MFPAAILFSVTGSGLVSSPCMVAMGVSISRSIPSVVALSSGPRLLLSCPLRWMIAFGRCFFMWRCMSSKKLVTLVLWNVILSYFCPGRHLSALEFDGSGMSENFVNFVPQSVFRVLMLECFFSSHWWYFFSVCLLHIFMLKNGSLARSQLAMAFIALVFFRIGMSWSMTFPMISSRPGWSMSMATPFAWYLVISGHDFSSVSLSPEYPSRMSTRNPFL